MQTPKERYESMLNKLDSIRANIHLVEAEKLDEVVAEMDKIELIIKQLEDVYGQEL
jgi:hypothetical protein